MASTSRKRRRLIIVGIGVLAAGVCLVVWLATGATRSPLAVGVAFVHREAYPKASFTVWVTNRTNRRIILLAPAVRYHTESGLEAGGLVWEMFPWHGDIKVQGDLLPRGIATLSVPARDYYKEGRVEFDFLYDADPLRRAVSKVLTFCVLKFGLHPQLDASPLRTGRPKTKPGARHAVWQWLYENGLLNGHIRGSYEGPWVPWEKSASDDRSSR